MPLIDHDCLPRGARPTWGSLLHVWAVQMLKVLNPHLHESFHVEPVIRRAGRPDDLGYFPEPDTVIGWRPPAPDFAAPVEFVALDVFEARVRSRHHEAAAGVVSLIAPTAKANPLHRRALIERCLGYLMEGAGVVVVDAVPRFGPSVTGELLEALGLPSPAVVPCMHLLSLRPVNAARAKLEAWQAEPAIGAALPTMPLWIGPGEAIPVDLESSFLETCLGLRIPITSPAPPPAAAPRP